jgi:hypothetical protein
MIIDNRRISAINSRRVVLVCWYHDSTRNDEKFIIGVFVCVRNRAVISSIDNRINGVFLLGVIDGVFGVSATKYENITNIPPI